MKTTLGFWFCARAISPAPSSAVEAVNAVRPYLIRLLRSIFFPLVSLILSSCLRNYTGGFGFWIRVELLIEHLLVNAVGSTDNDDLCARRPFAPLILQGNIHAPANHLQHSPPLRRVGGINHAFGPIDCPRQFAHNFP